MKKRVFYSEWAYAAGLFALTFGTAMMTRADLGLSMIVAPAYILHVKISEFLPFFSFGMAEYCFQFLLLVFMSFILRKVKISYAFSFVTAVIYGLMLDGMLILTSHFPADTLTQRAILYAAGCVVCAAGVAFLFRTYFAPEAYELFVREVSSKYGIGIGRFKTIFDTGSFLLSLVLSFTLFGFGNFVGIKLGTVLCIPVNGALIAAFVSFYDKIWEFKDRFTLRKYF